MKRNKMKKLIIAVVTLAVAIVANAGAVNWTIMDVASPASGYGYLFTSDTDSDDVVNAVLAGTFFTDYAGDAIYTSPSFTTEYDSGTILNGAYSGNTTLWMLALDGNTTDSVNNYFVGEEITQKIGASGTKPYEWSYNDNTSAWTAVPEPTSGLLMLLGVAGLALRRKRA